MKCPFCDSAENTKSGFVNGGKQRYKCKGCKRMFTERSPRCYDISVRLQALKLYREGMGFRAIGRVLKVSNVTVLKWIRAMGKDLQAWYNQQIWKHYDKEIPIVEIDEIWHFCKKNSSRCGFGLLFVVDPESSSPLRWGIVPLHP
jgi:transposase-like protein